MQWWEIPASFLEGHFVIRLLEPPSTSLPELMQSLRRNCYRKPFILEDRTIRRLQFGLRYAQSEMRLDDPWALSLAYTQKMMAALLFQPDPRHVVLVGLGGGSMTKFCYRALPQARITALEIDATVIEMRRLFEVPEPDERLRILHRDALDWFARGREKADLVLLDGCDRDGVAPAFCEPEFYQDLFDRLSRDGMLVANLIGAVKRVQMILDEIGRVFEGRCLVLTMREGGNRIVFAFRSASFPADWKGLQQRAAELEAAHGLPFTEYLREFQRAAKRNAGRPSDR